MEKSRFARSSRRSSPASIVAGDLALGNAHRSGHLGKDLFVASGRDAGDEDFEHALGKPTISPHGLISGDLDLRRLSRLRIASTKPGFVDDDLSLLEGDTPFLSAVVDDVAVGLLALLSRPRDRLGGSS